MKGIELEELQWIEAAKNGDHRAFESIVKRYQSLVARTTMGMLGNPQLAEDIGQTTFINLYHSLHKFKGKSSLGTYITRIAINLSLNEIKRNKRQNQIFNNQEIQNFENNDKHYDEQAEIIQKSLLKLKVKYRSIIVLRYYDGFSMQEISSTLKIPLGTVLSRLSRAQEQLKKLLGPIKEVILG